MNVVLPQPAELGDLLNLNPAPEVLEFLARRRSVSAVALGEPAPSPAELDVLLRIATRVPDHGKLAPWRFIVAEGADKAQLAARLEATANARGDTQLVGKLAKLKIPPLAVFIVSSPREAAIPEWEQVLSAGAVCTNLLYAALAMGYGANWITDWYSYDAEAVAILGLGASEKIAGCMVIGTAREAPLERERPTPAAFVSRWRDDRKP